MSVFMLQPDFNAIALSRKPPKLPVREVALNDLWMVYATFDGTASEFFDQQETERPFCFNPAAGEGESENEIYTNVGKQAAYCREHGEVETARELSKVGLKLGQVRAAKKTEPAKESNPYLKNFKGDRTKRIAELLTAPGGIALVTKWANDANCTIAGAPKQKVGAARFKK